MTDASKRVLRLSLLLAKVMPIPDEWIMGRDKARGTGELTMDCKPCCDWRTLINSWKRAFKWTDGLDCAFSVMLASITSVKALGSQLWCIISGPPSCLDGDTPIYDPIDKTLITVKKRQELGLKFHVYTKNGDNLGIAQALPPEEYAPTEMYEVTFKSGRSIKVTAGHRFWNGKTYVSVSQLILSNGACHLPTISDIGPQAQTQDARHLNQTIPDSQESTESDEVVKIEFVGVRPYYDFHVPMTNNYWAEGLFHHNCGKSSLCEALSINRKFIYPKSTLRGFHSGYDDGSGENHSLIEKIKDKTLVIKDGDAMLQAPNLGQILSEARDLYDTVSRSSYRNKQSKDHQGVRTTLIICGTSSLRYLDTSELGQRFVTCSIMEGIDTELEDEVLNKVIQKMYRGMSMEADGTLESQQDPEMVRAMQLTGGYVDYLRNNARDLLAGVTMDEAAFTQCKNLGKFVSYLRARPSKTQNEIHEREFSSRLVETFGRLAMCLAVVLNRNSVDVEVMRRTLKVALDTARGTSLNIAGELFEAGRVGLEVGQLRSFTKDSEAELRRLLKFLWHIGAAESYRPVSHRGVSSRARWRLTPTLTDLYATVMNKPVPTFEEEES